jgi:DNA invertase Pin-like site-specific DNA recombinase
MWRKASSLFWRGEVVMPDKVRVIPANTNEPIRYAVIYARVSSNSMEQLESLKAQISGLTKFVSGHTNWKLVDIHIDIASSKKGSVRPAFNQMIDECKAGLTDIVVVKNVSRFGRDTVKVLETVNELKEADVRVIFMQENLDTAKSDSSMYIAIISSIAQDENDSHGADVLWGMKKKAIDGSLKLYCRKCYGYDNDENGNLVINEAEAETVKLIFDLYLSGKSILGIIKELQSRNIKSPTRKDNWPKRSISEMLSDEKYIGIATVKIGGEEGNIYKLNNSHPAIISKEIFDAAQEEKLKRSNVVTDENGTHRSNTKYSSVKK